VLDACSGGSCYGGDRERNARRPVCCYGRTSTIGIIFWRAGLTLGLAQRARRLCAWLLRVPLSGVHPGATGTSRNVLARNRPELTLLVLEAFGRVDDQWAVFGRQPMLLTEQTPVCKHFKLHLPLA
jgi:hypothetical protein